MKKMWLCLPIVAALSACAGSGAGGANAMAGAEAVLKATQGNSVAGNVVFRQEGNTLVVMTQASGLTPGAHGFHVHEFGDCSAPDASSAGGHFNPTGKPHGKPGQADSHAGDMPELVADAKGNVRQMDRLTGVSVNDFIGKSVIIHAGGDDYKTQPTGNSGARVACGVIAAK